MDPSASNDAGSAARCTDSMAAFTVMVEEEPTTSGSSTRPWSIDGVATRSSVLAHRQAADGSMHVAFIDSGGPSMLTSIPGAGPYRFEAAAIPGTSCAMFLSDFTSMYYGCPGAVAEAAGLDHLNADRRIVPFAHPDGAVSVFTQSYASFTQVRRSAAGVWQELEQYESSVSYPTDVVDVGGQPVVCFISSADRAVILRGSTELVSAVEANSCQLAHDGSTLHVLTNAGYAQLPLSGLGGTFPVTPVPALASLNVDQIFVDKGLAYALGLDGQIVKVVPLGTGEPIVLDTLPGYSPSVEWDAAARAIRMVTSTLDTSGEGPSHPQTIDLRTRCLP